MLTRPPSCARVQVRFWPEVMTSFGGTLLTKIFKKSETTPIDHTHMSEPGALMLWASLKDNWIQNVFNVTFYNQSKVKWIQLISNSLACFILLINCFDCLSHILSYHMDMKCYTRMFKLAIIKKRCRRDEMGCTTFCPTYTDKERHQTNHPPNNFLIRTLNSMCETHYCCSARNNRRLSTLPFSFEPKTSDLKWFSGKDCYLVIQRDRSVVIRPLLAGK